MPRLPKRGEFPITKIRRVEKRLTFTMSDLSNYNQHITSAHKWGTNLGEPMRFNNAIELVAQKMLDENLTHKSITNMKNTIRDLLSFLGEATVGSVSLQDLTTYREHMRKKGFKPRTVSTYMLDIKMFFKRCHQLGIGCVDYKEVVVPARVKTIPPYLSKAEVDKVITAEPNIRNKALIALAFCSGARRTELANILARDYDGLKITLRVTKTGEQRAVYVSSDARRLIDQYLDTRHDDIEYLFKSERGRKLAPGTINWIITNAGNRVDLKLYPHLLRHSHATHFYEATQDVLVVKESLGHRNIQNTMAYTHAKSERIMSAHSLAFA